MDAEKSTGLISFGSMSDAELRGAMGPDGKMNLAIILGEGRVILKRVRVLGYPNPNLTEPPTSGST